jgi:SNF2 family DNA or RNA helicase
MSNLISVCKFNEHYVHLIDSSIDESFLNNQFYLYTIDKASRAIVGDNQGNLICRMGLSGLKQKLVEDIIKKQEDSIFTYKIKIEYYNSSYSNAYLTKRINLNLEIFLDLNKLKEKIKNNDLELFGLDSLLINKICSMTKFNADFWKKESIIKTTNNLSQPDLFQVQLFQYQLKTLQWMINLEKKIESIDQLKIKTTYPIDNILDKESDIVLKYDIINNKITTDDNYEQIKLKGGILADEMGLGKTITSVGLIASNPCTKSLPIIEPSNKNYNTKATLIICPSHLTKQWAKEIMKGAPILKKISILTKVNHQKTSYQDIINADVVIISLQFLMNFNYYVEHNFEHVTPSQIQYKYEDRVKKLNEFKTSLQNLELNDQLKKIAPNFEFINWYRVIIDEGHEIFGNEGSSAVICEYLKRWIQDLNYTYSWYVSGTPFINCYGFNSVLDFIDFSINKKIRSVNIDANNNYQIINKNINLKYAELTEQKTNILDLNKNILDTVFYRNTKESVKDELNIPPILNETITIELSELERKLYDSRIEYGCNRLVLRQLCCHPLISDRERNILGNAELSLSEVRDGLMIHHKDNINKYKTKLENLDTNNQSYHMLSKTYTDKIKESTYLINIFEKLIDDSKMETEEDTCCICMDNINQIVVTDCGHFYCKECIFNSMKYKKECPTCRKSLTSDKIYLVNKSEVIDENKPKKNILVEKYGSKMGKLIEVCKRITNNKKNRIIIFSQWDRLLNLIGNTLKENNIANTFVKGNVYQRNNAISNFKEGKNKSDIDIQVIMLSLENAASGTNLTEASHVIFTDPIDGQYEHIKAIENQAIGRACRIGQSKQVKIIKLITKDTIEEEIYNITKQDNSQENLQDNSVYI